MNRNEIMNDNFLGLTGQGECVNPRTREVEVDTDAFKLHWVTPGGKRYYTNREDENPNRFLTLSSRARTNKGSRLLYSTGAKNWFQDLYILSPVCPKMTFCIAI